MSTTPSSLVYRSKWSPVKPLVYSDDSQDSAVNCFIDTLLRVKLHTKRLTITANKYFYQPSDDYKTFVVRMRKIK